MAISTDAELFDVSLRMALKLSFVFSSSLFSLIGRIQASIHLVLYFTLTSAFSLLALDG